MRKALRAVTVAVVVVAGGVVLGSGVSGYAAAPGNQVCLYPPTLDVHFGGDGSYAWIPFGTRCTVLGSERTVYFGPGMVAWIAWIVAMTLLLASTSRRRGSPALRGALSAGAFLALCGAVSHPESDFALTLFVAMWFATPLLFVIYHLLTPRRERSAGGSLLATALLAPATFVVATFLSFFGKATGHAGAVLAMLVAAGLARWGAPGVLAVLRAPTAGTSRPAPGAD